MKSFHDLESLLYPRGIAVVGATSNPLRVGARIIENTKRVGFKGKIFPVNPKYDEILGFKCFPTLSDVQEPVDNVWIVLPNEAVLASLKEAEKIGVKFATVYSSGWGETGDDGKQREKELIAWLSDHKIRLLGPNTIGIGNTYSKVISGFNSAMSFFRFDRPGDIGFVSQSGAMVGGMVGRAEERGIEIGYYVHTGNEIDIDLIDVIEFMIHDEKINVIVGYIEGIRNPEKFIRVAKLANEQNKPLIFFKTGVSEKGKTAVASHTGAVSGSDTVYSAIFKQLGITRVRNHEELFEVGSLFSRFSKTKTVNSGRLLVFTPSGGSASIFADKCEEAGIELANLAPQTRDELSKIFPAYTIPANPLDIGGGVFSDPSLAKKCLEAVCRDPNVDILTWTLVGPPRNPLTARMIQDFIDVTGRYNKPTAVHTLASHLNDEGFKVFSQTHSPTFDSIESCVHAIKHYLSYHDFMKGPAAAKSVGPFSYFSKSAPQADAMRILAGAPGQFLSEYRSKKILSSYDIPVPRGGLAGSLLDALKLASEIGYPVVLKVSSPDILHKTEAGTVKTGIGDEESLKKGYREVMEKAKLHDPNARIEGVLVEEMAPKGIETILGVNRDPQFGPAMIFGLGGIFVEILRDVSVRVAPFDEAEARKMVEEIKFSPVLKGYRGGQDSDIEAIVETIMKIQRLSLDFKDSISEIDVNPLVVYGRGGSVKALDALIRIRPVA